ncbi:UNVERIFIED_CONTAM: hypothetical protein Slati_4480700 [Sesamum latifolium]|uniref:Uncharacterized protein n=1 Tax=Sesamum latifolium TaxID=2727402 RepID=A0AAW2SSM2_9LAMI
MLGDNSSEVVSEEVLRRGGSVSGSRGSYDRRRTGWGQGAPSTTYRVWAPNCFHGLLYALLVLSSLLTSLTLCSHRWRHLSV